MPSVAHLIARASDSNSNGGLNATGIGLIVGVGIIPAIILMWVVCWLMICYPHDRTCWCGKSRKRKAREDLGEKGVTDFSQDTLYDRPAPNVQRPDAGYRMESGSSNESAQMARGQTTRTNKLTRESVQSVNSASTIAVHQEPKRFV